MARSRAKPYRAMGRPADPAYLNMYTRTPVIHTCRQETTQSRRWSVQTGLLGVRAQKSYRVIDYKSFRFGKFRISYVRFEIIVVV
jgi:hypothetical protein